LFDKIQKICYDILMNLQERLAMNANLLDRASEVQSVVQAQESIQEQSANREARTSQVRPTARHENGPGRPYDPNVLSDLTSYILSQSEVERGVINPATPNRLTQVDYPKESMLDATKGSAAIALTGLFRWYGGPKKAERLHHRINVARVVGESIDNPRAEKNSASDFNKQRISYTGIHKKEEGPKENPRAYPYSPITVGEQFATWRMNHKIRRSRNYAQRSAWIKKVNPPQADGVRNSNRDKMYLNNASRKADRLDKKARKNLNSFYRLTRSDDFLGKLAKHRLNSLTSRATKDSDD
jgi:hypothetical protein